METQSQIQQNTVILVALIGLLGTLLGAFVVVISHWLISRSERINQLKLAVVDKRLSVHQEAYGRIGRLPASTSKEEEFKSTVYDHYNWWYDNCLYLDKKCRESYIKACDAAVNWYILNKTKPGDPKNWENFRTIIKEAIRDIESVIDLPPVALPEKPEEMMKTK